VNSLVLLGVYAVAVRIALLVSALSLGLKLRPPSAKTHPDLRIVLASSYRRDVRELWVLIIHIKVIFIITIFLYALFVFFNH